MAPVFKLAPGVQSYAWGKKGQSSLAAQFSQVSVPDFTIDDNETYAEVSAVGIFEIMRQGVKLFRLGRS
jgi:mannose-6-phosphate isomerase class I